MKKTLIIFAALVTPLFANVVTEDFPNICCGVFDDGLGGSGVLMFPAFDPTLGTLESVNITANFGESFGGGFGAPPYTGVWTAWSSPLIELNYYSFLLDMYGFAQASSDSGPPSVSGTTSAEVDPSQLSAFVGTVGSIIPVGATLYIGGGIDPAYEAGYYWATGDASFGVTYNYQPASVPEPTAFWPIGLLLPLLLKRKKKADPVCNYAKRQRVLMGQMIIRTA
jgi:hypothetical protein